MLIFQKLAAIETAPLHSLDAIAAAMWQDFGEGRLTETEAEVLTAAIEARRKAARTARERPGAASQDRKARPSYFPPKRPPQRSPNRQRSLERRRSLAAYALPHPLLTRFTVGEQAALRVVADEVRDKGTCTLPIAAIAARSGTSESTVRRALKAAGFLGLLTVEERRVPFRPNLTNVIRIVSREWLAWISRGPRKDARTCSLPPNPSDQTGRVSNLEGHETKRFSEGRKSSFSSAHKRGKFGNAT